MHLVCRSEQRGKEAQDAIIKETKNEVGSCSIYLMSHISTLESPFTSCGHV